MKYYKDIQTNEVFGFDESDETQLPFMQAKIDAGLEDITGLWPLPPPPQPIPTEVSMRQARLALFQQGILDTIQPAIDAMQEPQKTIAQINWDYATTVKRDDDLVVALSAQLNLDDNALDTLFTLASTL